MSELDKIMSGMAERLIQQSKEIAENAAPTYAGRVHLRAMRMLYVYKPLFKRLFISNGAVIKAVCRRTYDLALWGTPSLASRVK